MENYDITYKLYILGENTNDKKNFIQSLVGSKFQQQQLSTIGYDFETKTLSINNKLIKLNIWNFACVERYRSISKRYLIGTNGIILIYSITNYNSFHYLKERYIKYYKPAVDEIINIKVMLIGNDSENEISRNVSKHEAASFANKYNMLFFEVSSLNHTNVQESIIQFTKEIMEIIPIPKIYKNELSIVLNTKPISHKKVHKNSCL